eukprot:TRINITY_DN6459_c0_g1_i2.p1 TRINITY_DN6459_c0_g1~~TRINITY_DN6459_c0_g1_i2.p1  ORF type:complete len:340 (-),score=67.82 TRINITY_DN6459_c0_g1_i2:200-1219(-)
MDPGFAVVAVVHFLSFLGCSAYTGHFAQFQYRKHSGKFKVLWSKKFVRLTLIGAAAGFLQSAFFLIYFVSSRHLLNLDLTTDQELLFNSISLVFFAVMGVVHVSLLYLRTKGILSETSNSITRLLKFLAIIFFFSFLVSAIVIALMILQIGPQPLLTALVLYCLTAFAVTMVVLDSMSTLCFAMFLKRILAQATLESSSRFVRTKESAVLMARCGIAVSICGSLTVAIGIVEQHVEGALMQDIVSLVFATGSKVMGILWIFMKLKMDQLVSPDEDLNMRNPNIVETVRQQPLLLLDSGVSLPHPTSLVETITHVEAMDSSKTIHTTTSDEIIMHVPRLE